MATRLLLIRHAPTDTDSRLCGSFDLPLSPDGRRQVQALVRQAPTRCAPAALYTSSLLRAKEVAVELGRAWRLEPRLVEWAREIHCGEVEGMPLDRLREEHAHLWAQNQAQDDEEFAWPGGETYRQFRRRILEGVAEVTQRHDSARVAIVTHAGVISQILGVIRHRPASVWATDRPDPFTATEIQWHNGAPEVVLSFNQRDWY